jgi:CubicO group peptidase (beta-lactamase class C family)
MTATSSRAGMAPDRLQRLDHWLQRDFIDTGRLPGAQLLVARHGEVVHRATLGRMDVERDRPLRDDALWRIYSMTKPITSVALMMLWEEGRFTLNDPVHRFIPAWRDLRVWEAGRGELMRTRPARQPMTMRHILSHTAGLTYGSALLAPGQQAHPVEEAYAALKIGTRSGDTLAQMVDKLAQVPLRFDPGSAWQYSLATDVCGHLVQVISGQPFERFVHERILAPLGMVDTGFHVPADKIDRLTTCYRYDAQRLMVPIDSPERSAFVPPPVLPSGGGGLVGTLADYHRFCELLRGGGDLDGVRLLGPRTLALMRANHLPGGQDLVALAQDGFSETANAGIGFGLGFATTLDSVAAGVPGAGDFFWGGMASTIFWVDPHEDLLAIFMTQLIPSRTYNLRGPMKGLVYASIVD